MKCFMLLSGGNTTNRTISKLTYVYRHRHHCSVVDGSFDSSLDQAQYSHHMLHHNLYNYTSNPVTH